MIKADVVSRVQSATGLSAAESAKAVSAFLDVVTAELAAGNEIPLQGFGKLSVKARPARKARNPQTGATIDVPASKTVSFAAAKALRDALK